jgi:hypothetical protein
MANRSVRKKSAILNEYQEKEHKQIIQFELDDIFREGRAKNKEKYIRHHSHLNRNLYLS